MLHFCCCWHSLATPTEFILSAVWMRNCVYMYVCVRGRTCVAPCMSFRQATTRANYIHMPLPPLPPPSPPLRLGLHLEPLRRRRNRLMGRQAPALSEAVLLLLCAGRCHHIVLYWVFLRLICCCCVARAADCLRCWSACVCVSARPKKLALPWRNSWIQLLCAYLGHEGWMV